MKVAAVQFCPVLKDMGANIALMEEMVSQAANQGADLIVLPELCTSGYSFMNTEEALPFGEGRFSEISPSILAMQEASKSLGVAIAWGFIERGDADGKVLYNSQALMVPGRDQPVFYRKRNPWGNDHLWATPGNLSPPIVVWKGKRIGLLICRDIKNSDDDNEDRTLYEPGDADIVCFSANFGDGGFPSGSWINFAKNTETELIVSNRYGQEENNNFGEGGICVIHPSGKVECGGLKWSAPCVVYSTV